MNFTSAVREKTTTEALDLGAEGFALRLTHPKDGLWRLQSAAGGHDFDDFGAAQILARDLGEKPPLGRTAFSVEPGEGGLVVTAGTECLEIALSPFSLCIQRGGELLRVTDIRREKKGLVASGSLYKGEALFGSGERFNRCNQRGKKIKIMAVDCWAETEGNTYVPVPFILSSRVYGLLLNRYEFSVLDLGAGKKDAWTFTLSGAPLDLYLFTDDHPSDILKSYSDLTGHAPMPAPWLFGIQVSRHGSRSRDFATVEGIEAMIQKMDENDFPWDAVIAEGWPTYNRDKYGDLRKIVDKVHGLGRKFLVYEPCGRVPHSDDPVEQGRIEKNLLFKTDYLIKEPDGNYMLPENWKDSYNPADHPNPKRVPFVDITNPEAMEWWLGHVWGTLVKDIGVDGCKIDFCEQIPDHIPLVFADGRTSSGAHHWYPTLYNCLMYRFYQQHRSEGGMCFSRGGGIGAQRYPFLWAGDQRREYRYLRPVLTAILSSGFSGIPFMSYDMAGYWPAQNLDPEDRVFIRGTEMGCFSSNMQTHGFVTRPYDFPEPIKDIYRVYAKLHQALRPYLLEQAEYASLTGTPLLRHLFLFDPKDQSVFDIEDEYMLGNALLVAPVFKAREKRDIYLPRGNWRNILDGKTYSGGQTLKNFPVPFRQIPVFLLEGNDSKTIGKVLNDAESLLTRLR